MREAVRRAARRIGEFPDNGVRRPDLAPDQFRFLVMPVFDYLVVYQADGLPRARIMRMLHGKRNLEAVLAKLLDQ
jgi:toxin ParE1/3/4